MAQATLPLETETSRASNAVRYAPCGCGLLVTEAGEWAMQRPCSPRVWTEWEHQVDAAAGLGLSA